MRYKSGGDHKVVGTVFVTANDFVRRTKEFQFKDSKGN